MQGDYDSTREIYVQMNCFFPAVIVNQSQPVPEDGGCQLPSQSVAAWAVFQESGAYRWGVMV